MLVSLSRVTSLLTSPIFLIPLSGLILNMPYPEKASLNLHINSSLLTVCSHCVFSFRTLTIKEEKDYSCNFMFKVCCSTRVGIAMPISQYLAYSRHSIIPSYGFIEFENVQKIKLFFEDISYNTCIPLHKFNHV